jgi:hypothetical protein
MKKIILLVSCGLLALSAAGQKGRAVNTPVSVSYLLPKTCFNVEVSLERVELIPGPFAEYAEQQLGTRPSITARGQSWRVKGIRVIPVPVPDARRAYTINASGEYGGILLSLSPEGFLSGAGAAGATGVERPIEYMAPDRPGGSIEYARFGIESTQKEILDSNFSMMEVEGVTRRVWDPIERHVLKGREEYVQEITDQIFAIRQRRLDALTSPGGLPEGSVKALDALEEAYLSLFFGRTVTREETRVFTYTPEKTGEATPLFRFSETRGVSARDDVTSMPYLIEVVNVVVPGEGTAVERETPPGLTYRVPAVADLRVYRGDDKLFEGRCVVPQLGYLKQFPLDVIGSEGLSIEFYPALGSIKSVTRNR